MNCFYHKLAQNSLFKLFFVALLSLVATSASAAEADVDLGALELDKVYQTKMDFNSYIAHYTATKSGVLTYHQQACNFQVYADEELETPVETKYNNYDTNGFQMYSFSVEAGSTYYFYLGMSSDNGKLTLTMDDALAIKTNSLPDGSEITASGRANIEITFNQAVTFDKVTLTSGTHSANLTTANEEVRVTNGTLMIEYGATLTQWYQDGYVKAGDKVSVKITGLRSSIDETVLYNNDGVLELTYTALGNPVTLVSAGTANGAYTLENTVQTSAVFNSYFAPGDENGIYVFNFSEPLDPTAGTAKLQFGSQEALDYAEEDVNMVFSNDNKTITIDVTGKMRTSATLGLQYSLENSYGYIILSLNGLKSTDGQYVYTGVSGSIGSYNFPITYKEVKNVISSEFTPNDKFTSEPFEIYISGYSSISYDGVKFSWIKNREEQSVVVPRSELTIDETTYADYDAATILVTVPAEVKDLSNVTVTLNNLTTTDGVDHTSNLSNVFNYVAPSVASDFSFTSDPAAGATVESCKQLTLTFPGYEKVFCKATSKLYAYVAGRTSTSYTNLDAATAGAQGNQLVQSFGNALANNDHYTVTFPEGYFELDDNLVNPAFTVTFAVYKDETQVGDLSFSATPSDGSTVESCDQISIVFNDYDVATPTWNYKAILTKKGSDTVITLGDPQFGEADNEIVQSLGDNATEAGTYTVTFPEGMFTFGENGNVWSPEFSVSFTIEGAAEEPAAINVVSDPADGSTVESCEKILLTFPDYEGVSQGAGKATIWRRGGDLVEIDNTSWGEEYNQIYQELDGNAAEDGYYIVTFPAGYFLLNETEDSEPIDSPEFTISFIVESAKTLTFNVVSDPADGSTVESCEKILLTFPDYEGVSQGSGKATIWRRGGDLVEIDNTSWGEEYNQIYQNLEGNATEEGYYIVTFPAGYFLLNETEDSEPVDSPEFTISFSIESAKNATFTVVSNPADGSTVESCTEIELTFPDYVYASLSQGKATISKDGGDAVQLEDAGFGVDENQMVQSLGDNAKENGVYTVTFPAGYFLVGEDYDAEPIDSPEFIITFTVSSESGVSDIAVDGNGDVQYFNLNGVKVNNPANGVYIVKRGNTVTKQNIK